MKIVAGILLGMLITLSATQVLAQYHQPRLYEVDRLEIKNSNRYVVIVWDEVEKTNCYVYGYDGGISCVRSMHYD